MAGKLPVISGRDAVQAFAHFDWKFARQSSSHIILVKDGEISTLSVPDHRELARGTLRGLIRLAGLTVDQFASQL